MVVNNLDLTLHHRERISTITNHCENTSTKPYKENIWVDIDFQGHLTDRLCCHLCLLRLQKRGQK